MVDKKRWDTFIVSVFFVLGFSAVFSLLGVLLQGVLAFASDSIQIWLSRIGGAFIIFFGLYLMKLIQPKFLNKEKKIHVNKRFKSKYLTAFVFGAAFAVGWTPCVGAILGAILTLAVTSPSTAFFLLFAYSLGLGIPFLLVGLFTNQARALIKKSGKIVTYLNYVFGVLLVVIGIFVFTNQLGMLANFEVVANFMTSIGGSSVTFGTSLNIGVAFIAGLLSFLSPCVLPLIPAFLTYLASEVVNENDK